MKSLSKKIEDLRIERGLSKAALGRAIGSSAPDITSLYKRMDAGGSITVAKLFKIAKALNVPAHELIKE